MSDQFENDIDRLEGTCPECGGEASVYISTTDDEGHVYCDEDYCGWIHYNMKRVHRFVDTDTDRLDESPRDVLRELSGRLGDHELDREPPVSDKEEGEIEGLKIAIEEINYVIENGDARPINTGANQNE